MNESVFQVETLEEEKKQGGIKLALDVSTTAFSGKI